MPRDPFKLSKSKKKPDGMNVYRVICRETGRCYGCVFDQRGQNLYSNDGCDWRLEHQNEHVMKPHPEAEDDRKYQTRNFRTRREAAQYLFDRKENYTGTYLA